MPSPGPFLPVGLRLIHEETGKLEPLLVDGDIRGSLAPTDDECFLSPRAGGACCVPRSDHCFTGERRYWNEASLSAALREAQISRFHRGSEAVSPSRGAAREFVRDFVKRESVDGFKAEKVKARIGVSLDAALSSGLLSKVIKAIAGHTEIRDLRSVLAAALDHSLRTGQLAGVIAMVAAEQDLDADPPIPGEPPACSIFEDFSWKDAPPAPAWLSRSLSQTRPYGERKSKNSTSQLDSSHEGSHVFLHIYDFSEWTRIPRLPLHHVGVEVYRCEYYFSNMGVGMCNPGTHSLYLYREAIPLGQTPLSRREWRRALGDLRMEWSSGAYARLGSNCQDFVLAVCDILGVRDRVPAEYRRLAELGDFIHETRSGASGMVNHALQNLVTSSSCKPRVFECEDLSAKACKPYSSTWAPTWWCGRSCSNVQKAPPTLAPDMYVCSTDERVTYII